MKRITDDIYIGNIYDAKRCFPEFAILFTSQDSTFSSISYEGADRIQRVELPKIWTDDEQTKFVYDTHELEIRVQEMLKKFDKVFVVSWDDTLLDQGGAVSRVSLPVTDMDIAHTEDSSWAKEEFPNREATPPTQDLEEFPINEQHETELRGEE